MVIHPYLNFSGRCEEAMNFYGKVFDQKVTLMRFKESPEPCTGGPEGMPAPNPESVMHSCIQVGDTMLMASDGCPGEEAGFKGVSLTLNVKDEADAKKYFAALGDGGSVFMPLGKTFYSPCFGMLTDKFGVFWMIIVPQACPDAA